MHLPELSSDSISLILAYLDGVAISSLLSVGSSLLKAKIGQSCKELSVTTWPFMRLPVSLFRLPLLEILHLGPNEYEAVYPWRLNGGLPLPAMPMISLTRLAMHCAQSFCFTTI
jgi:hypothetical protein